MKKIKMKFSVFALLFLFVFLSRIDAACFHDPEAQNDGSCKADAVLNPNGTWTVNGYNCEVYTPAPGYPNIYDCVIDDEGLGGPE
ncbi:MAG: hypothetical protein HEP71_19075 [Roseivirga sp.]|nr:hypothetical protein [Roseivirga sp.]